MGPAVVFIAGDVTAGADAVDPLVTGDGVVVNAPVDPVVPFDPVQPKNISLK